MNICLDCLKLFEKPGEGYEHYDDYPWLPHKRLGCPYCGGDYDEAKECSICGNYITDDYIRLSNGNCICDNCYSAEELR